MSAYSWKDGDYGFLTGIQSTKLEPADNINKQQQSSECKFNTNSLRETVDQNRNQTKSNTMHEKLSRKKSWWKSMFPFQRKSKKKELGNSTILRHKSDAGILSKPILKQDKNRKYRSLLIEDGITVYEGLDFEVSLSKSPFNCQNAIEKKLNCDQGDKIAFAQRERSASLDFLDRMKPEKKKSSLHRHSTVTTLVDRPKLNKNHTIETAGSHVRTPTDLSKSDKKKPTKPPRKAKLITNSKSNHANKKHASLEDLLTNKTDSGECKNPIRRSMSMTFLRKPFRKKKEEKLFNKCESKSQTLQHLNDNVKEKTFIDKDTGRVINVYEKYPRTKAEQKKVLVHIQTREEIPVENGIPQWDASSYQYSSSTRYRLSQSADELNPTFETKPKPLYKESSFVGNYISQHSNDTADEAGLENDISEATSGTENSLLIKKMGILSLDAEPVNRELHCGTQSVTKAIIHNDNNSSFSNSEPKNQNAVTNSTNNTGPTASTDNTTKELAASCEDISFGRSFILTGMASDKVPDLITRKHPYLTTSSPVRHMAQCLRHASISGKSLKISPNRIKLNMEPEKENKIENESLKTLEDLESTNRCSKTVPSSEASRNEDVIKHHVTFDKNFPPRHRRCYSDPDLSSSSFVRPMMLHHQYKHGNGSPLNEEHGKKPSRSRSARTDRLLYRMKTRLHRLEKLRDKSPNEVLIEDNYPKVTGGRQISNSNNNLHGQLPLTSRRASVHDLRQSEIQKYKKFRQWKEVQLPGCNPSNTPLSKFKQLIDMRVASYNNDKQTSSKVIQDINKNILPSVPFYENIWPSENNISETMLSTDGSKPIQTEEVVKRPQTNVSRKSSIAIDCGKTRNNNSNDVSKLLHSPIEIKEVKFNLRKTSLGRNADNNIDYELNDKTNIQKAVMQPDDIFLSSTPVKNYAKYAREALEREPSTNHNSNRQLLVSKPALVESQQSASSYAGSLSPNPSLLPSASDFFLRSLLEQQEEIKQTMLSEMMKIQTKYNAVCSETTTAEEEAQTSFNDWKDQMKFRWDADWHGDDEMSSESDANSQKTLTRCSSAGTSSSGETITNICEADHEDGYATMSSNESTVANYGSISRPNELVQRRCITSNWVESNLEKRRPVEYVLPRCLSLEDGSNFLEWDCEETDL